MKHTGDQSNKRIIPVVLLLLILSVMAGATLAYLFDSSDEVVNTFIPSQVTADVVEDIISDPKRKQNVQIQNTGDVEAYIRAAVVVTWQNEKGDIYRVKPVPGTDYAMEIEDEIQSDYNNGRWVPASDGFYYWTAPVDPASGKNGADSGIKKESCTGILIRDCTVSGNEPEGYSLHVEILASAVQSIPTAAVTQVWKSGVSGIEEMVFANRKISYLTIKE